MRSCAKMRCGSEAATTVILRYEAREVVIRDLVPQRDPNLLDLCPEHAGRLTPPIGWRMQDERAPMPTPAG